MGKAKRYGLLSSIYRKIKTYPGRMAWFIARLAGIKEEEMPEALRALTEEGYRIREDEEGRLWAEDDGQE